MTPDWATPERTHRNRLPMTALRREPTLVLDGEWDFQLLPSPEAQRGDTWRPIAVPGVWTLQGTGDLPAYTNIVIPWGGEPPLPPADNPTGVYRRTVEVPADWAGRRTVLHVGAAESVLLVEVDGIDVGMSKDSHLAAEFDVTELLTPGVHELVLTVVKWSDATFVEDQDQWWHGGITRSVFLFHPGPLEDLHVDTTHTGGLSVRAFGDGDRIAVRLNGAALPADGLSLDTTVDAAPWSPELPNVHDLEVDLLRGDEVVDTQRLRIGFTTVEVRGLDLLVNGERMVFRGANRHDVDTVTGRVLTREAMTEEVLLLKRFGFNAVRTSHYPNDPYFLDLCDEHGLLVIDEADIEAHAQWGTLCDDPRYADAFVDRVSRMVQRDRNHACVGLWSLGNESGYGANHLPAAAWVRENEPTRPLHYEGSMHRGWSFGCGVSDVTCPMYPPIARVVEHVRSGQQTRPVVLCEFSHAMGNSNGDLAAWVHLFETEPGLQGGFVWELRDHGLVHPETGRTVYGGGFGESPNDGVFCVDGLTFSDRSPKPALHEHKQLAAPARVEDGVLRNAQHWRDLSWLTATWEVACEGQVLASGDLPLPDLGPGESAPLAVPAEPGDGETLATVRFFQREDTAWSPAGELVCWSQWQVSPAAPLPASLGPAELDVPGLGLPVLSLFRAPTDNDRGPRHHERWDALGLRDLTAGPAQVETTDDATVVRRSWSTSAGHVVLHERQVSRTADGLLVTDTVTLPEELHDVPRVGLLFETDATDLSWFGAGPHETYPDRRLGQIGLWSMPVAETFTPYLHPQESGGRADVRWLELAGTRLTFDRPRQISAIPYSAGDLADAAYHDELTPGRTRLHVDLAHRGLGSASCGPDLLPEHQVPAGVHTMTWAVSPARASR